MTKKQKRRLKITLYSILLAVCITLVVLSAINFYYIWLNEFNAQTAQLGFYKRDIKLLNQTWKIALSSITLTIGCAGGCASVIGFMTA